MFARLWQAVGNLFRRQDPLDRLDYYKPDERLIFTYFDGSRDRRVDPLPLYKRLKDVWPELSADIRVARSPSKGADDAHSRMVEKAYKVFEAERFVDLGDGKSTGLGEVEVLELLDHFLAYTGGVKKNWSLPAISVGETSASTDSSSTAESPTPSTSDSGSTASVPSTEPATPSPREPESPSAPSIQMWATGSPLPTARERQSS